MMFVCVCICVHFGWLTFWLAGERAHFNGIHSRKWNIPYCLQYPHNFGDHLIISLILHVLAFQWMEYYVVICMCVAFSVDKQTSSSSSTRQKNAHHRNEPKHTKILKTARYKYDMHCAYDC